MFLRFEEVCQLPQRVYPLRFFAFGEKIYEELLMDEEGMKKTENKKIYIGHPININSEEFLNDLEKLRNISSNGSMSDILEILLKMVPTFKHTKNI